MDRLFSFYLCMALCFLTKGLPAVVFTANIWVYWISPDSASRYLYMFHPLLIIPLVWFYQSTESNGRLKIWVNKTFSFFPWFFTGILLAGIFLVPIFLKTKGIVWVLPLAFLAAALLLFAARKQQWSPVYQTVMVLLVVRFAYGFITVSERSQGSQAAKDKAVAKEMAQVVKSQPVYLLDSTRISYTISFYLQKELDRVVGFKKNIETGDRLIMPDSLLQTGMQVEKNFLYKGNPYSMALVK